MLPSTSYAYSLSPTELACNVPPSGFAPGESGSAQLFLATTGDNFTPTNLFVNYVPPVVISSVKPGRVDEQGNHSLVIGGANFPDLPGLACRFGGGDYSTVPALWLRSTAVRCLTPTLSQGEVSVEITFNGVDFAEAPDVLTVDAKLIVSGVSPLSGPISGGTKVTVTGTGFDAGYVNGKGGNSAGVFSCLFGERQTVATVQSPTRISCQAPVGFENAGSNSYGLVPLTIVRRHDDRVVGHLPSMPAPFTYLYLRDTLLTTVVPASGPSTGGTRVSLVGLREEIAYVRASGVEPEVRCKFGATTDAAISMAQDQSYKEEFFCVAPPFLGVAPANVSVAVSLNGGENFLLSEAMFAYFGNPTIDSVEPSAVSVEGGSMVILEGQNFPATDGFKCIFGMSDMALEGTWLSPTILECVAPPHPPGFALVSVMFNAVDISPSTAILEYYEDLSISSISPANTAVESGEEVTLRGTGLVDSCLISFRWRRVTDVGNNTNPWSVSSLRFVDHTAATFMAPHVAITDDSESVVLEVEVSNNALDFVPLHKSLRFAVSGPPRVYEAFPRYGSSAGATVVRIVGANFVFGTTSCRFRSRQANSSTGIRIDQPLVAVRADVRNSTHLRCTTPEALPGEYFIEVMTGATNDFLAADVAENSLELLEPMATAGFTFIPAPRVTTVQPVNIPEAGGVNFTIEGVNLTRTGLEACRFGEVIVGATWLSISLVTCQAPPAAPGLVSVELTLNGADWSTVSPVVRYEPTRFVYALSPPAGPLGGGSRVIVSGVGFADSRGEEITGDFYCSFGRFEVSCPIDGKSKMRGVQRATLCAEAQPL